MSKPILYFAKFSPPARSCLITIAALGLDVEKRELDLQKQEHMTPEYLKINPLHTVPVLVDSDGSIIHDSHAINSYLVDKYGGEKFESLYPKDLVKRSQVNAALFFHAQNILGKGRNLFTPIMFFGYTGPIEDRVASAKESYADLENLLKLRKFVAADTMTIADFSMIATLSTSTTKLLSPEEFPKITAWKKHMYEVAPYIKEVNDPGAEWAIKAFEAKLKEIYGI